MLRVQSFVPFLTSSPCVFCMGSFDGVHRGHQYFLRVAKQLALSQRALLVVLAFSNNPRAFLSNTAQKLIITPIHKALLLEEQGVDIFMDLPFTREVSLLFPEQFLMMLERSFTMVRWVVSEDVCFGHNREGSLEYLKKWAQKSSCLLHTVEKVSDSSGTISSTRIRQAIHCGDLTTASSLLGRPYSIVTSVCGGVMDVSSLCLPPQGTLNGTATHDELNRPAQVTISQDGCLLRCAHLPDAAHMERFIWHSQV